MTTRRVNTGGFVGIIFCVLGFAAVAGCEHPATETTDYRVEHKIAAVERVFALSLSGADNDSKFEARDEANMRQFAREYLRRGRGPFLITRPENDPPAFERIAALVVGEGVPAELVYFQVPRDGNTISGRTRLSFSGYEVRVPECGDWSGNTGFVPNNQPHSNFGCSYQRNFGLMLANPGDLNASRGDATNDAFRTDVVVGAYRTRSTTIGRGKPTLEQGEFADVK